MVPFIHHKGTKGTKKKQVFLCVLCAFVVNLSLFLVHNLIIHHLLANLIEHAVDKTRRIGGAKAASQLDRLIESDSRGRLGGKQQLESAQAQHVAIDAGHARQAPIFRRLCQPLVNLLRMTHRTIIKSLAKRAQSRVGQPVMNKALDSGAIYHGIMIALKEQL